MNKELKPIIKEMEKLCKRTMRANEDLNDCCCGCPLRIKPFCLKKIFITDGISELRLGLSKLGANK